MIYIGVDPGLSGAVAFIGPAGTAVYTMPVQTVSAKGFVKNAVDVHALSRMLEPYRDYDPHAWVERVSAFPGQGVASMFSLGHSFGSVLGVLAALGIPFELVEPKDWKARYRLSKDKALSLALARRLYPTIDLSLKKDHGKAEALLIARHGQLLTENKL